MLPMQPILVSLLREKAEKVKLNLKVNKAPLKVTAEKLNLDQKAILLNLSLLPQKEVEEDSCKKNLSLTLLLIYPSPLENLMARMLLMHQVMPLMLPMHLMPQMAPMLLLTERSSLRLLMSYFAPWSSLMTVQWTSSSVESKYGTSSLR